MRGTRGAAMLLLCFIVAGARSQENAVKTLPSALFECYDDETHKGWNQLPHNIKILIEIIRKIEDHSAQHVNLLDMRYLSTAILHRFRQDGIVRNPHVKAREGILPYAPLGKQFFRHAQTLRVIPGNAFNFPNDSLTPIERCTLHSMLSSSIDIFERGDESRTCRFANYAFRRFGRSTDDRNVKEDVETLTAEQIDLMTGKSGRDVVDPNSLYPAYPRNHPSSERLVNTPPLSKCPIENGVVQTPWGTVSGGSVIAGIAAGLEPMMTRIDDLMKQQVEPRVSDYASDVVIDNKFLATLSGDLAEVALKQGPQIQGNRYVVGVEGNWNSTTKPLFYFLNSNENLEMTGAEIRGDIDGLILANRVLQYYEKSRNLRLSQVLDMYYGERGFFDRNVRACKRREHFVTVAPTDTLKSQTLSAVILLNPDIGTATFSYETVERFVKQAVDDLGTHIPTMNRDESCDSRSDSSSMSNLISETAANLTIVIDTTWPFDSVNKILSQLLLSGQLDVNKYNSQYTLVNAATGSVMFNSSHTPLTTQNFNQTFYNSLTKGFNLAMTLDKLRLIQTENLNKEQKIGWGGGKSDVVVIVAYHSSLSQYDKTYCNETLKRMQEEAPDATFLVLTYGAKDRWFEVVVNPDDDIISINTSENSESFSAVDALVTRIKQVPRRLINTQCGARFERIGNSQSSAMKETVAPGGINYYRMHPNYFFSDSDNQPKIRVQSLDGNSLSVCTSSELLHENATEAQARASCETVRSGRPHIITLSCGSASYISECKPFYLSISANVTTTNTYACSDLVKCRYPDSVQFSVSYENLVCKSDASAMLFSPLIMLLIYIFAHTL